MIADAFHLAEVAVNDSDFEVTLEVVLLIAGALLVLVTIAVFAWMVLRNLHRDSDGGGASDDGA